MSHRQRIFNTVYYRHSSTMKVGDSRAASYRTVSTSQKTKLKQEPNVGNSREATIPKKKNN